MVLLRNREPGDRAAFKDFQDFGAEQHVVLQPSILFQHLRTPVHVFLVRYTLDSVQKPRAEVVEATPKARPRHFQISMSPSGKVAGGCVGLRSHKKRTFALIAAAFSFHATSRTCSNQRTLWMRPKDPW